MCLIDVRVEALPEDLGSKRNENPWEASAEAYVMRWLIGMLVGFGCNADGRRSEIIATAECLHRFWPPSVGQASLQQHGSRASDDLVNHDLRQAVSR